MLAAYLAVIASYRVLDSKSKHWHFQVCKACSLGFAPMGMCRDTKSGVLHAQLGSRTFTKQGKQTAHISATSPTRVVLYSTFPFREAQAPPYSHFGTLLSLYR
mgnify:CR=1 FL=1